MKKILVTGGCGYVGSMLVPELLKHNYDVTVLDLEIYGNQIKNKYGKVKYIKGDIRDPLILKNIIPGIDAVMLFYDAIGLNERRPAEILVAGNAESEQALILPCTPYS